MVFRKMVRHFVGFLLTLADRDFFLRNYLARSGARVGTMSNRCRVIKRECERERGAQTQWLLDSTKLAFFDSGTFPSPRKNVLIVSSGDVLDKTAADHAHRNAQSQPAQRVHHPPRKNGMTHRAEISCCRSLPAPTSTLDRVLLILF